MRDVSEPLALTLGLSVVRSVGVSSHPRESQLSSSSMLLLLLPVVCVVVEAFLIL
jgi:hypothetical protein